MAQWFAARRGGGFFAMDRCHNLRCRRGDWNRCLLEPAMLAIGATHLATVTANGGIGYDIAGTTLGAHKQHGRP